MIGGAALGAAIGGLLPGVLIGSAVGGVVGDIIHRVQHRKSRLARLRPGPKIGLMGDSFAKAERETNKLGLLKFF